MTTETKSASLARLSKAERAVILAILDEATARGLAVSVFDGEEWAVAISSDRERIEREIAATCTTSLVLRERPTPETGKKAPRRVGSVFLVHGNDVDVIADHSDSPEMEALLAPAFRLGDDFRSHAASKGLQR